MSLAVDLSNYTVQFSVNHVHCWMANGVDRAIVQAVQGGGQYPPGRTAEQLYTCAQGPIRTDAYVLPFDGDGLSNLRGKRSLVGGFRIGRWWADFEEPMGLEYMRFVLAEMDAWNADHKLTGFYTGKWFYDLYMHHTTEFAGRPLWIMDRLRPPGSPVLFGGWTTYALHQYWLDATLCGISGLDVSYVNPKFEQGEAMAIRVGEGMAGQMAGRGDIPLFGHRFYQETDDDGRPYDVEECYGTQGRYVSCNSTGQWLNVGPL